MAETVTVHQVADDGYCFTCQMVPCSSPRRSPREMSQLDRIELLLHRVLRGMGEEVEVDG